MNYKTIEKKNAVLWQWLRPRVLRLRSEFAVSVSFDETEEPGINILLISKANPNNVYEIDVSTDSILSTAYDAMPRPCESHIRQSDLEDGDFNARTWTKIMKGIREAEAY